MVASALLVLLLASQGSEKPEVAPLQVDTYLASESRAHDNIFALEVDGAGRIIVGHGQGITVFDGVTWRASGADLTLITTLVRSPEGTIYVGSSRGVGRVRILPNGDPAVDWLAEETWQRHAPGLVKSIAIPDEDTVYAAGDAFAFRYDLTAEGDAQGELLDLEPEEHPEWVTHVFSLRGKTYAAMPRVGIQALDSDSPEPLLSSEELGSVDIQTVLPEGEDNALVFTVDKGLHLWTPSGIAPWDVELAQAVDGHRVYAAQRLQSGNIAVSTSRGLLICNGAGKVQHLIDESAGLSSDATFSRAVEDQAKGLWTASFGGISRIQQDSELGVFGPDQGIQGTVLDIWRYQGRLYVASRKGLWRSDLLEGLGDQTTFSPVAEVTTAAWDLLENDGVLWVATGQGLFRIAGDEVERTSAVEACTSLAVAGNDTLYAVGSMHVTRVDTGDPNKAEPQSWPIPFHTVRGLYVDDLQRLWVPGITGQSQWKIQRFDFSKEPVLVEELDQTKGVPSQPLSMERVGEDLLLGYPEGLSLFHPEEDRFEQDHPAQEALAAYGGGALNLKADTAGGLWFWNKSGVIGYASQGTDGWTIRDPYRRLGLTNAMCFMPDEDGVVWVGSSDSRIARFDPTVATGYSLPAPMIIALHNVADGHEMVPADQLEGMPFGEFDLRFRLGWTQHVTPEGNQYRTRLQGLNSAWSAWSQETYRDFPGLREGDYRFQVEARTVEGRTSPTAELALRVLPPWYRSPLAYGAYGILGALGILTLLSFRQNKIRQRVKALSAEIEERRLAEAALVLKETELQQEIVEHERTAAQREKLDHQLHEAQKLEAVGRLAAGVAHDFNNILTVIRGEAELGASGASLAGSGISQKFSSIHDASERGANLTKQLLAFSGKQTLSPRVIALDEALQEMRGILERVVLDDVQLDFFHESNLRTVKIDPVQFERAMMNLVVNAAEAMPLGGRIRVSATNFEAGPEHGIQGDCVRLAVEDNGIGMDPDTLKTAFEPFFSTKGPGRVSGLGLATVHGIVQQAHGHITLRSERGAGTTVEILLPAAGAVEIPVQKRPDVLRPAPKGTTALVCDNDVQVRRVTTELLERAGYEVLPADSPEEALRRAHAYNGRIDVLVTDVIMPGLNGRELADQLAHARPNMRVVYVSGYPSDVLAPRGILDLGIRFVAKPYTTQHLLDSIAAALGTPPAPEGSVQADLN